MNKPAANVIVSEAPVFAVEADWLATLKRLALAADNRRARICLHQDVNSAVQQMLIVFHRSTLIAPHRQQRNFKSYAVLVGRLSVSFFDESGNLTERHTLGETSGSHPSFLRFNASRWHVVVPHSEWTAFIETGEGPFTQSSTEYAPWGPDTADPAAVKRFLDKIEGDQNHWE